MEILKAILLSALVLICSDARSIKRSPSENGNWCSKTTPCGWEIYKPYVRTFEYFMKSPCECPAGSQCVRYSDDISISAYVHRCSSNEN